MDGEGGGAISNCGGATSVRGATAIGAAFFGTTTADLAVTLLLPLVAFIASLLLLRSTNGGVNGSADFKVDRSGSVAALPVTPGTAVGSGTMEGAFAADAGDTP